MADKSFGERLKASRVKANMSQGELADKVGVSRLTCGRYERGEISPTAGVIAELCSVLNIDANRLLLGARTFDGQFAHQQSPSGIIAARLEEEIRRLGGAILVAGLVGVGKSTVYYWMQNENIPADKLSQLAELGADTHYIITGQRLGTPTITAIDSTPANLSQLTDDRLQRLATTTRYLKETLVTALAAIERAEGWLDHVKPGFTTSAGGSADQEPQD